MPPLVPFLYPNAHPGATDTQYRPAASFARADGVSIFWFLTVRAILCPSLGGRLTGCIRPPRLPTILMVNMTDVLSNSPQIHHRHVGGQRQLVKDTILTYFKGMSGARSSTGDHKRLLP